MRSSISPVNQGKAKTGTGVPKFLRSLYDILYFEDPTILSWSADGSCFQVFDVPRLERQVLPRYFKHSKFTSLQRQLNNFGFRKWTKTRANVCTFSHDVLRQGHPDELVRLVHEAEMALSSRTSSLENSTTGKRPHQESEGGDVKRHRVDEYIKPEPEATLPCLGGLVNHEALLDGFNETALCALDWSLVVDQRRVQDLQGLMEPLTPAQPPQQPAAPSPMFEASVDSLPPLETDLLGNWLDLFDDLDTI